MGSTGVLSPAPLPTTSLPSPASARAQSSSEPLLLLAAFVGGAMLGLSAPGFGHWYLAWIGMVPLFWLIASAGNPLRAALRGTIFGIGYNLVAMCWYLSIRPVFLLGTFSFAPILMSGAFWLAMATHQGLMIGAFSGICRALPLVAGWLPTRENKRLLLPAFVLMPLLWVLIVDKIGNAPALLGVPWSQLEYSQWQQLPLLQCTSVVGGIGLCALIVLVNVTLAAMMHGGKRRLFNALPTVLILAGALAFGAWRLNAAHLPAGRTVHVSALQANLVHRVHAATSLDIAQKYLDLTLKCPPGICVWPEWSLVCDYTKFNQTLKLFGKISSRQQQSWICGVFDSDKNGKVYNAVCSFGSDGAMSPQAYRKRLLVPFGEFTPEWVRTSFLKTIFYGPACNFEETAAGNEPVVFKLKEAAVAPILCFENLYPELVAASVRRGADIIVDCSNNSWFYKSILSDQLVAFSVMRAVENHRPFVFATALGPSTIIDANGHVVVQAPREKETAIGADLTIPADHTPFTWWCR